MSSVQEVTRPAWKLDTYVYDLQFVIKTSWYFAWKAQTPVCRPLRSRYNSMRYPYTCAIFSRTQACILALHTLHYHSALYPPSLLFQARPLSESHDSVQSCVARSHKLLDFLICGRLLWIRPFSLTGEIGKFVMGGSLTKILKFDIVPLIPFNFTRCCDL